MEYFPGFTTLQLVDKVQEFMNRMGDPAQFQGRILHGEVQTVKRNVLLTPHLCLYLQKAFQQDVGHFSDLDQKRSGIPLTSIDHEENGTESLN